ADLVDVDARRVAQAALAGPARDVVLHAVAVEEDGAAVVAPQRHGHVHLATRGREHLVQAVVVAEEVDRARELGVRGVEGRRGRGGGRAGGAGVGGREVGRGRGVDRGGFAARGGGRHGRRRHGSSGSRFSGAAGVCGTGGHATAGALARRAGTRRGARAQVRPGPGASRAGAAQRPSASTAASSSGVREKPVTWKFASMRSGVTDFGMTTNPWWRCQRSTTWVGVTPCAAATSASTGASRSVRLNGLYPSSTTPRCASSCAIRWS